MCVSGGEGGGGRGRRAQAVRGSEEAGRGRNRVQQGLHCMQLKGGLVEGWMAVPVHQGVGLLP